MIADYCPHINNQQSHLHTYIYIPLELLKVIRAYIFMYESLFLPIGYYTSPPKVGASLSVVSIEFILPPTRTFLLSHFV